MSTFVHCYPGDHSLCQEPKAPVSDFSRIAHFFPSSEVFLSFVLCFISNETNSWFSARDLAIPHDACSSVPTQGDCELL